MRCYDNYEKRGGYNMFFGGQTHLVHDTKWVGVPGWWVLSNFSRQTKLEVNWSQIDHFSLQKNTKIGDISKSDFAQVAITKKPTPLHFSTNMSETFKIEVNMDFANTNRMADF